MTSRSCLGLVCALVLMSACTGGAGTPAQPITATASQTSAGTMASPTPAPTTELTATPTASPSPTPVPTPFVPYTIDEPTRYEGTLKYDCEADGCWRQGSTMLSAPEHYYPDIDANNAEIAALLSDIGLPADPIEDDATAWQTMQALWAWLNTHVSYLGTAPEAWDYLTSLAGDNWPSIANVAGAYARYHTLPWGACNSKALTFATLAYRVGLNPDRVAAAYFATADHSIQHFYVVFRSGDHWYYIDPTCEPSSPSLPSEPASVGCLNQVDYEHPFTLALLPGSTLTRAMLVK
jgi:hypothetical protein